MLLVESEEEVWEGWLGSHEWHQKLWRDISGAGGLPWDMWGLNPELGFPAHSTRTGKGAQISYGSEK